MCFRLPGHAELMQEVGVSDHTQSTAERAELRKLGRDAVWISYHHGYIDGLVSMMRAQIFLL